MQLAKYIKQEYPTKLNDMQFSMSVGELNQDYESDVILRQEIMKIVAKYLSLNIKSKSINTAEGINIVIDHIFEECSNLELQEINFIFRSGVMGKFGVIYNDISIDTICGKDGWIETYYKDFRRLRKGDIYESYENLALTLERVIELKAPSHIIEEYRKRLSKSVVSKNSLKLSGNEITEQELYSKDENYAEFRDAIQCALLNKVSIEGAKQFLKGNGCDFDKYHNKILNEYNKSGIAEFVDKKDEYISYHLSKLILKIRHDQLKLIEIYKKALKQKTTLDDAKQFYKIKGLTDGDFKDDCEAFCKIWNDGNKLISESQYINECFRKFIVDNIFKTKG